MHPRRKSAFRTNTAHAFTCAALLGTILIELCICTAAAANDEVSWDQRDRLSLNASAALGVLADLPGDDPAEESWGTGGGREGWFGKAWVDVDGNGCDTRNEILGRDLTSVDYAPAAGVQSLSQGVGAGVASCPNGTVYAGVLNDPYTGETINFQRGKTTSSAVQIDHVVALNYVYAHGGWEWDEAKRLQIANDPLNLLAVDGAANESKGACGPATCPVGSSQTGSWDTAGGSGWWPDNPQYRCAYAQRFVSVLAAYQLGIPQADKTTLQQTLTNCTNGGNGTQTIDLSPAKIARSIAHPTIGIPITIGLLLLGTGIITRALHKKRRL